MDYTKSIMNAFKRNSFWATGFLLLIFAVTLNFFFMTDTAEAKGERYQYINANNIRAESGVYAIPAPLDRVANSNTYSGGVTLRNWLNNGGPQQCNYSLSLNVDDDNGASGVIEAITRNADPGHSGCPTGDMAKDMLSKPVILYVPDEFPFKQLPMPPNCGSINPPPAPECGIIPPFCPGSLQTGGPVDTTKCPFFAPGTTPFVRGAAPPTSAPQTVQCSAENALSWFLCGVLEAAIKASETMAGYIDSLLEVAPLTTNGKTGIAFEVWQNIRNLANIMLIFVMFAIIFSQSTSMGISAYGVKKILPKLVVAAILANLSYYICAIGVDAFNVLGAGMEGLLTSALNTPIGNPGTGQPVNRFDIFAQAAGIAATVGVAVVALAVFWGMILLGILVGLLALAARHALIIIAVIVAPIAFVLWVLPNTERYFRQWGNLFLGLLFVYPLIMIILAGTRVAASIIVGT